MSAGALVLVATPIGNLGDLSPRAIAEFARAEVLCCEDTRRTGKLLQHAGVRAKELCVVNDHSEFAATGHLVERMLRGDRVVLVSDAGTPGISDPGERLVAAAVEAGIEVVVVPGPAALIAALVASGLATARFVFEGFIPRKGSERSKRLHELASERRTVVLYEAPHRLERTLVDLAEAFGAQRRVAVARELTKMHEQVWRGTLDEAVKWAATNPKGEFVLVLDGAAEPEPLTDEDLADAIRERLRSGDSTKDAAAAISLKTGVSRRHVYELALRVNIG